jgi:hypothetical protein
MASAANGRIPIIEDEDTGHRFVTYRTIDGCIEAEVLFHDNSFWMSQEQMAHTFGVERSVITKHTNNVLRDGEVPEEGNVQKMHISPTKPTKVYSLHMLLAVGFRVGSPEGREFRIWALDALVQILTKGFYVNKRALKGKPDRFAELRRIIQDIRADEANMYAELRRILAMCKDYDPNSKVCRDFFAAFQNRLLYAITGATASELVIKRADADKPNMGLQTWSGDYPLQDDALTGKNYLGQLELEDLNRLVSMVLDFFEDQVERGWLVSLNEADGALTEILTVNKRKMLPHGPRATAAQRDRHGKKQYKIFDARRREIRKAEALSELNETAKTLPKKRSGKKGKSSTS